MLSAVRIIQKDKNDNNDKLQNTIDRDKERTIEKCMGKLNENILRDINISEEIGFFPLKTQIMNVLEKKKEKKEKRMIIEEELKKRLEKTNLHPIEVTFSSDYHHDCFRNETKKIKSQKIESNGFSTSQFINEISKLKNINYTEENRNRNEDGLNDKINLNTNCDSYNDRNNFNNNGFTNNENSEYLNHNICDDTEFRNFDELDNKNEIDRENEYNNEKLLSLSNARITCTEIEKLRISQLLRDHEMNKKLQNEKRLFEERKIKKMFSQNDFSLQKISHSKRRKPLCGYISTVNTSELKFSKYSNFPTYSNKNPFSMSLGVRRINEIPDWENRGEYDIREQLYENKLQEEREKEKEKEKEKEVEEEIKQTIIINKKYENNLLKLRKKKKRKNNKNDKSDKKTGKEALRKFSVSIGSIASSMDDFEFSNYAEISSLENNIQNRSGKR